MYKGIYIALSGAVLKQRQMEIITQNLANVNTTGYRKADISFKDYLVSAQGDKADGRVMSHISSYSIDFSNGNNFYTGNPFDIALEGSGFIALEGNLYTRRGDLRIDREGFLTNYNGKKVLGRNGPIKLPRGRDIRIDEAGTVIVDGVEIDSIQVVDFPKKDNLTKIGEEAFSTNDNPVKANALVKQGYLETSNVDIVMEMFKMIETLREFETYQKAIQMFDEASAKVNNEIARI
jgi:flagellar basal-body rod protein FlgG